MSTRVTIASASDQPNGAGDWHVFLDALDHDDRVHLEVRGLLALQAGAAAGDVLWAVISLPRATWWTLVRSAAEARALGRDIGGGLPERGSVDQIAEPAWAALVDDANGASLREVAGMARERAREVVWLRRAVEGAIRDGRSVLAVACADALAASLPLGGAHKQRRKRALDAQGVRIAAMLRVTFTTDAAAIRWLLARWSPRLHATALEALRRGNVDELARLIDETVAEADRFA